MLRDRRVHAGRMRDEMSKSSTVILGGRRNVVMTCLGTTIVAGRIRLAEVQSPKEVRVQKADMRNESGVSQI